MVQSQEAPTAHPPRHTETGAGRAQTLAFRDRPCLSSRHLAVDLQHRLHPFIDCPTPAEPPAHPELVTLASSSSSASSAPLTEDDDALRALVPALSFISVRS